MDYNPPPFVYGKGRTSNVGISANLGAGRLGRGGGPMGDVPCWVLPHKEDKNMCMLACGCAILSTSQLYTPPHVPILIA